MPETTTIQITKKNRDELRKIGSMGDDYNKVIEKLIKEYKDHERKSRIDRLANEADEFIKTHRDEFVSVDEL